jgi:hypothetical protein
MTFALPSPYYLFYACDPPLGNESLQGLVERHDVCIKILNIVAGNN